MHALYELDIPCNIYIFQYTIMDSSLEIKPTVVNNGKLSILIRYWKPSILWAILWQSPGKCLSHNIHFIDITYITLHTLTNNFLKDKNMKPIWNLFIEEKVVIHSRYMHIFLVSINVFSLSFYWNPPFPAYFK